jgi:hypothetical protein
MTGREMHQDVCWLVASVLWPVTCGETEITSHTSHLFIFKTLKESKKIYKLEICKKCVTPHHHSMNSQPERPLVSACGYAVFGCLHVRNVECAYGGRHRNIKNGNIDIVGQTGCTRISDIQSAYSASQTYATILNRAKFRNSYMSL